MIIMNKIYNEEVLLGIKNNRKYIGFEISKDYYNIIMNRIKKYNNQPMLFQEQNNLKQGIRLQPFCSASN